MCDQFDEEFRRDLLDRCTSTDFDGHTEFEKLSPVERLRWLSNTIFFLYSAAKNNPDLGCNDFFKITE
jgi:hypothetical protein